MSEEGLSPREATRKAMGQITGALVGVAVVLSAVFVPVAFSGGSVGAIYRQFSLTIVSAMLLSVFVALVAHAGAVRHDPEACRQRRRGAEKRILRCVQSRVRARPRQVPRRRAPRDRSLRALAADLWRADRRRRLAVRAAADRVSARRGSGHRVRPGADAAGRDAGASRGTCSRTCRTTCCTRKAAAVDATFEVNGFNFAGRGQNQGLVFVRFKDWSRAEARRPQGAGGSGAHGQALRVVQGCGHRSDQSAVDSRAGNGVGLRSRARGSRRPRSRQAHAGARSAARAWRGRTRSSRSCGRTDSTTTRPTRSTSTARRRARSAST